MPDPTRKPGLAATERFERALDLLGLEVVRWRGSVGLVKGRNARFELSIDTVTKQLAGDLDALTPAELAIAVAQVLSLPIPPELMRDLDSVRPWLRPRLVHPREFKGPNRLMCRRPAFADLVKAVSVGNAPAAPFVTTADVDRWGLDFEEVVELAVDNLRDVFTPDVLQEVDDAPSLLTCVSRVEPAPSVLLMMDTALEEGDPASPEGVVASVPATDTALMLPVFGGMGAQPLAALVHFTLTLHAEEPEPLSDAILWFHDSMVDRLPATTIEEDGRSRVQLEAIGPSERLLRILGALE